MTVQPISPIRSNARLLLIVAATAGLILSLALTARPAQAGAEHPLVDPIATGQATNYDCDDLVEQGFIEGYDDEDKSGDNPSGEIDLEHSSLDINGTSVAFEADPGWLVVAVNVKGGQQGGNVYVYESFPGGGVEADSNLQPPDNPNGEPAGISHVVLCLIEAPEETPTPTPEGSVEGGTGTPAASLQNSAMSLPSAAASLATLAFGLILLASLGALAYANVKAVRRR